MFDRIKCSYPLPDKEIQDEFFQTKNLENGLLEYEIVEGGWLFKIRDYKNDDSWETVELDKPKLVKHTGCINFYTFTNHHNIRSTWYEYQAYFVNGKLKNIEVIDSPNG